jgi:predicted nucleotidyltransferase
MTLAELLALLRRELIEYPGLVFAVLFGSWARNRVRPDSDVDVAFLPAGDWTLSLELDLQARLTRALGRSVELVRLDQAPLLLGWEVVKHGLFISGDADSFAQYQTHVALEHADAAPLIERAARHYARRIAELGVPS